MFWNNPKRRSWGVVLFWIGGTGDRELVAAVLQRDWSVTWWLHGLIAGEFQNRCDRSHSLFLDYSLLVEAKRLIHEYIPEKWDCLMTCGVVVYSVIYIVILRWVLGWIVVWLNNKVVIGSLFDVSCCVFLSYWSRTSQKKDWKGSWKGSHPLVRTTAISVFDASRVSCGWASV